MQPVTPPWKHLPEYLMEAAGLGLFMISANLFAVLLFHTHSPVATLLPGAFTRRALMGLAMGGTAIALIYCPWGKQSGAHLNPCVTFTFWRLGKITRRDALGYAAFQTTGGLAGAVLCASLLPQLVADPGVNYVVTIPGPAGVLAAWLTEFAISFVLLGTVLVVSNRKRWANATGLFAGLLVAANIAFTAPLSGMSMNPARTLASAVPSHVWTAFWVYLTAPLLGMLAAAECYVCVRGRGGVHCAKLHHQNARRCIFCETRAAKAGVTATNSTTSNRARNTASKMSLEA